MFTGDVNSTTKVRNLDEIKLGNPIYFLFYLFISPRGRPRSPAKRRITGLYGREVGFALYFYNFSTFIGHSGLYLEDLFVWPEDRGKGYGKALLLHLVKIAREHHCGRMEWTCLNWNQPSIDFYLSLGAVPMKEWTVYRLDASALERLSK